jgi:hypothetical protein
MTIAELFSEQGPADANAAGPTLDEVRRWPATVDVRHACAAIGISPAWGYELIKHPEDVRAGPVTGEYLRVLSVGVGRCGGSR